MSELEVEDFLRALQNSADLRERVRSVLLADDFLALPGLMRANTEAIAALTERMDATERRLGLLEKRMGDVAGRLGNVEGEFFEFKYDKQASGRLGRRYQNVKVLRLGDEAEMHKALKDGRLSDEDWDDAILTDCVVVGVSKTTGEETLLAIEVSKTVDESDVERANRRAAILRKVWPLALAAVDGEQILPAAKAMALQLGVTTIVRREAPEPSAA